MPSPANTIERPGADALTQPATPAARPVRRNLAARLWAALRQAPPSY